MRQADRLVAGTLRTGGPWPALLAVTALGGAALQMALPYALGATVDALVTGGGRTGSAWPAACMAMVAGVVLLDGAEVWAAGASGARAAATLRHRIMARVLGGGPAMTARLPEGDLVTRMGLNAEETGRAPEAVITGAALLVPTVGSVIALALIDPWLAMTLVVALVIITVVLRAFLRDTTALAGGYQRAQGDIAGHLVDALTGARTIAAAGTAPAETRRVLSALPRLRAHGLALWRANARAGVRAGLTVPLLEVTVLAVGGFRLAAGGITVGSLYAAARYAVLGAGLGSALGQVGGLARARAAAGRVSEVLDCPPMEYGAGALPAGTGTLEFRGVVLPGFEPAIDLILPGGSATAVVGRSGTGKSLLAAVAARLADPAAGSVVLDGVPIATLSRTHLRGAIGFAPERPVLIGGSLGEAISPGDPDRVMAAAAAAAADLFILPLPDGYATRLEDAPMSGGERQRIGLARAFAQAGRLLVLDDATSSLDTITEARVLTALTARTDGRTRLIVTHRVATAVRADQVIWLEDGRVRACAPHHELWRDPGYRAVFEAEEAAA